MKIEINDTLLYVNGSFDVKKKHLINLSLNSIFCVQKYGPINIGSHMNKVTN